MVAVSLIVESVEEKAEGKDLRESGKMVVVSVSETYDLHTEVNKMTLIGIHTPTKELIQKTYPGLAMNCKYFRVKSVDVVLSTAQTLPLGVGEIGLDTGKIRPQDMMNPILYKAVSNDSWSTLEARLMGLMQQNSVSGGPTPSLAGSMADVENDFVTGLDDEHGVYYSLLSNRDGFKIAHPRDGLRMKGLIPLVFEKYYSNGENYSPNQDGAPAVMESTVGGESQLNLSVIPNRAMRGRPHPMPKMNTTFLTGINDSGTLGSQRQRNGMGNGTPDNFQIQMPDIMPVMLGAIILPPVTADTGILYYRMVTRAFIEFTDVRPIQEITAFDHMNSFYAPLVYHTDYASQSSKMDAITDMVDIKNGNIEKIMEGR